jgi:hypothetical protein
MHYNDHNPPHFEAWYNDYRASIDIQTYGLMAGYLPPKVLSLVIEWTIKHQKELLENWELRSNKMPLKPIIGLDQE